MTDSERALWSRLRGKQILEVQFYRQKPIGNYIVDFYAAKAKIVVEEDGAQHLEEKQEQQDAQRDKYLKDQGLYVMRFNNIEVLRELDSVMEEIYRVVKERSRIKNPPGPLFQRGESVKAFSKGESALGIFKREKSIVILKKGGGLFRPYLQTKEKIMLIGQKVRELRKTQKLTLTELSQKSGVQLATLSRIENNKMTGTLDSHANIAKALGITITQLYSDIIKEENPVDIHTPKSPSDVFVHSDKASYEILTGKVLAKKMMPTLIKIEPQGKTNIEQNQFGTEKFIFVLEGEIDASIGNDTFPLLKHNTLYFDASIEHQLFNKGKAVARILCVVTPVAL